MRDSLEHFSSPTQSWFRRRLGEPTRAQALGWPCIASGHTTLLVAPTGSGKTLAAFMAALDQLMFRDEALRAPAVRGVKVLYVSPLKALGADIERNLWTPVTGLAEFARAANHTCRAPSIAMRTGDSTPKERVQLRRDPSDILITTPESLYLMLTSSMREALRSVDTVIIDEIHALVPSKRGAHLALSLERLERLRTGSRPLQRIGLSATQTPLDEAARFLGGFKSGLGRVSVARPVSIVDAGQARPVSLSVRMPAAAPADADSAPPSRADLWSALPPALHELVSAHASTMIFVNNRALTERLSGALNELAGYEICLAHHGSVSKERRQQIEARLKAGELRAIVATSSLELGIDVGAVDLVVQIEAPPSITSALQRVGRSGHRVGLVSKGVIFPKHRADLLSCAVAVSRMREGLVESSRFPRNPLDVLAQQLVALCAGETLDVEELFFWVRGAAPYAELARESFDSVLDMLSGKYASDAFAELRPRLVWDRRRGTVRARQGAGRIAVTSGGTIPDRGLFGVYLRGERALRVGELDEEMVFESRVGDVFVLGASSWRIDQITHDRVYVIPAPAEPGRLPFWRGDAPGRPAEFGRAIGALSRSLLEMPRQRALRLLQDQHALTESAAELLLRYLEEQRTATGVVPSDENLILERFVDEVGDTRVCLLSPYGARVHAPWAIAAEMNLLEHAGVRAEATWHDDGIVFRLPETVSRLGLELLIPEPDSVRELLVSHLGNSALFASRFRENATRALLMPRRRPGGRTPLWAQRKRSARLLAAASEHRDFPIYLETYRECLQDVFDLETLCGLLEAVAAGRVRVLKIERERPSAFASSLLFSYAGNFVYDRDAPAAERRARVLGLDHSELRQLLGEAELRQLLDPACIQALAESLSGTRYRAMRHADALVDALLGHGDLSSQELSDLSGDPDLTARWLNELTAEGRIVELCIAGEPRFVALEDAARYRDALGASVPVELPAALAQPSREPLIELVARYARNHVPFQEDQVSARFGVDEDAVRLALEELVRRGRLDHGEFTPGVAGREWCDREVLRLLKKNSLRALRRQIEPVAPTCLAELVVRWQHLDEPRSGMDALLDSIEQLQAAPLVAADLESEVLPARVVDLNSAWLDELTSTGEVVWRGLESIGERNGRIALYLADQYRLLAPPTGSVPGALPRALRERLRQRGASFFYDLLHGLEAFPPAVLGSLWEMVWAGEVTNDTLAPLRSLLSGAPERQRPGRRGFRSRRSAPIGSEGRWSLLPVLERTTHASAESLTAWAHALLARHAIVTREAMQNELLAGGLTNLMLVLRALEERARVRRGYFVAGLSGQQFAAPSAADRLRRLSDEARAGDRQSEALVLAASDPANPYGSLLPWPEGSSRPQRSSGAKVVLLRGQLLAYANRGWRHLSTFFEGERLTEQAASVARALGGRVASGRPRVLLVESVDGAPAQSTPLGEALLEQGFMRTAGGSLRKGGSVSERGSRVE